MSKPRSLVLASALLCAACIPALAAAAEPPAESSPKALIAAQQKAMAPFAYMDGVWRGTARTTMPDGTVHVVTQTERIGPLLDGAIKLIEGRGYNADGSTGFNAFAVLGWDVGKQAYTLQSHAMGRAGEFPFKPTSDGYVWEIPAGPMTIRYTATIQGKAWHEVGERVLPDGKSVRFFEMQLQRIGDSAWPAAGAVPAR